MNLRSKLILVQTPALLMLGLIFFLVFILFSNINDYTKTFLVGTYKSVIALDKMRLAIEDIDNALWHQSNYVDDFTKRTIEYRIQEIKEQLAIQDDNIGSDKEKELTELLHVKWEAYQKSIAEFIATRREGTLDYKQQLEKPFYEAKEIIQLLIELSQDEIYLKNERIKSFINQSYFYMVLALFIGFISVIITIFVVTKKVLAPISQFISFAQNISTGHLEARINAAGNDELTTLSNEFNIMADKIEEYRNSTLGEQIRLKKLLKAAINALGEPLIIFDKTSGVLIPNKVAREFFAVGNNREIIYENIKEIFSSEVQNFIEHDAKKDTKRFTIKGSEFTVIRKHITFTEDRLDIILLIFKDLSKIDLKGFIQLEKIINIIEELLLPLTSIHLAIHICLEQSIGDLTQKQEEFLATARNECYKMRKMISSIQDLQKLEDITTVTEKAKVSLASVLQECEKSMEIIAGVKNIKMQMDFPPLLDDIYANKNQISLVINNLMDNAIHHSLPNGTIQMRIKDNKNYVSFLIHNYGSYIPEQFQRQIFEKYFQLPDEKSNRDGLGLYIAKRIIEDHGGEIGVRSSPKLGTTFWFKIPKKGK